jgi:hypothetical protein
MAFRFLSLEREKKDSSDTLRRTDDTDLASEADLPPVVARMVVEIRSDGTRTVARGALEDLKSGEKVAIQAQAQSPLALAQQLTKTLLKAPSFLLPDSIRDSKTGKLRFPGQLPFVGRKKSDS